MYKGEWILVMNLSHTNNGLVLSSLSSNSSSLSNTDFDVFNEDAVKLFQQSMCQFERLFSVSGPTLLYTKQ